MMNNFLQVGLQTPVILHEMAEFHCPRSWSWESDQNHWSGYHFWFVQKGGARVVSAAGEYNLTPGDCFLFDLSHNHSCTHDPDNPLSVLSAYFKLGDGSLRPERYCLHRPQLQYLFEQAVSRFNSGRSEEAFIWLLPVLSEFFGNPEDKKAAGNPVVSRLCEQIDRSGGVCDSLEVLSKRAGYSKNQLLRLFRKQKGVSLYRYQLENRINRAKSLLIYSNLNISEIADQLGFFDSGHFSKQFKAVTGQSPREYRQSR